MPTTSLATYISIRDKLLTAIEKLAGEGVSSYSIGDQSFTLADIDTLMERVEKLDRKIAMLESTTRVVGRNRINLRRFNG